MTFNRSIFGVSCLFAGLMLGLSLYNCEKISEIILVSFTFISAFLWGINLSIMTKQEEEHE